MEDPAYTARKQLARANQAFYAAFSAADAEAMRAVWAEESPVRCVHPAGGVLRGHAEVLGSWDAILTQGEPLEIEMVDVELELIEGVGWVTGTERIRARAELGHPPAQATCTNLFVREEGEWRMVLHHASPVQRRTEAP